LVWKAVRGGRGTVIKGALEAAVHRGRGYRYMGVHEVEEGGLVG
jgi:hypothetical protein